MIDDVANRRVVEALHDAIDCKGEIGVQIAAYLGGELVVDAWAGLADRNSGREVTGDTLFNVFSVSKAIAATAVHIQAEHGRIDYDRPVADYWAGVRRQGQGRHYRPRRAGLITPVRRRCRRTPRLHRSATGTRRRPASPR